MTKPSAKSSASAYVVHAVYCPVLGIIQFGLGEGLNFKILDSGSVWFFNRDFFVRFALIGICFFLISNYPGVFNKKGEILYCNERKWWPRKHSAAHES